MNRVSLIGMINIIALAATATAAAVIDTQLSSPGCPDEYCGGLKVSYPFGTKDDCFLSRKFFIYCNETFQPPKPFLGNHTNNVPVLNISLHGELVVNFYIAKNCYNNSGSEVYTSIPSLGVGAYKISTSRNKFMAVGCDTYATLEGHRGKRKFKTGCISSCENKNDLTDSCSGVGCCEISIPTGLTDIEVNLKSYNNHTFVHDFNPCSYAFLVEDNMTFSGESFRLLNDTERLPVVLRWAIRNESCKEAEKNSTNYACIGKKTKCVDADGGYLCQCSKGYEGNPYLRDGCKDIDECKSSETCGKNEICRNSVGNFTCDCRKGYHKSEMVCNPSSHYVLDLYICIPLGVCITLVIGISLIYWGMKKRKAIKLRLKFFEQNGGLMLQQQLSSTTSIEATKIFSADELKGATNNYNENRVVGQGGYGIVYKGILPTNKVVAIKKSKFRAQRYNEQFINEVVLLLQINHRNVVKLLGCCLETKVPVLVYEFISNGTLYEHIHNKDDHRRSPLSWELRLKIATGTAGALAYLHSATSTPIIHRDVKTGNILLDENFTAKISDFGASRLIPPDQNKVSTVVEGTFGYLDPEYMQSSQLTEKSDVYSFGVVLAELLTGKKVLSSERPEEERSLAMLFVSAMKDDRLLQIIDDYKVVEGNVEALKCVANLTERCLRVKSEERPTMKEVEMELEGVLRTTEMHQSGNVLDMCVEKTASDPSDIDVSSGSIGSISYDVLVSLIFYWFSATFNFHVFCLFEASLSLILQ